MGTELDELFHALLIGIPGSEAAKINLPLGKGVQEGLRGGAAGVRPVKLPHAPSGVRQLLGIFRGIKARLPGGRERLVPWMLMAPQPPVVIRSKGNSQPWGLVI